MKRLIIMFLVMACLEFMVVGIGWEYEPFYAMERMLIPLYEGRIVLFELFINFAFIMLVVVLLVKEGDDFFGMYPYLCARSKSGSLSRLWMKKNFRVIVEIIITKILADLCFAGMNGTKNIDVFVKLSVSTMITIICWALIIGILYLLFQSGKKVQFIMLSFLFVAQYAGLKYTGINLILIAGKGFIERFGILVVEKIVLSIVLYGISYVLFDRTEVLGGNKYD